MRSVRSVHLYREPTVSTGEHKLTEPAVYHRMELHSATICGLSVTSVSFVRGSDSAIETFSRKRNTKGIPLLHTSIIWFLNSNTFIENAKPAKTTTIQNY